MHSGGPQANDVGCSTCHRPGGAGGDIAAKHIPVSPPNPHNIYADATPAGNGNTNAAYVAAAGAVPPGAKVITYVVQSVSTWTDATAGNVLRPQIAFKIQLDGADVVFPDPTTATELIPSFVGSPSAYFVFAVPQDGKAAPADFNASASAYLRNIWNGTGTCSNAASTTTRTGAGTLAGPDASGFYTLQLTCAIVPANATMLTGGIGYTYALGSRQSPPNPDLDFINNTQPFTQIEPAGLPVRPEQEGGRRHPGLRRRGRAHRSATRRVDGRHRLHRPARHRRQHASAARATSRWASGPTSTPASATTPRPATGVTARTRPAAPGRPTPKDFIHAHPRRREAHQRRSPGTRSRPRDGFFEDDLSRRAQQVRDVPPARAPTTSARARRRRRTRTCWPARSGRGPTPPAASTRPTWPRRRATAPVSATTRSPARTVNPDPTTLVVSPIVAACSACHDSPIAIDHMQTNGGSFYEARSTAFTKPQQEECLLCHGPGAIASIADRHAFMP